MPETCHLCVLRRGRHALLVTRVREHTTVERSDVAPGSSVRPVRFEKLRPVEPIPSCRGILLGASPLCLETSQTSSFNMKLETLML